MTDNTQANFLIPDLIIPLVRAVLLSGEGSRKGDSLNLAWKCFMVSTPLPERCCVFGKCFQNETHISAHSQYSLYPALFPSASSWVLHTAATSRKGPPWPFFSPLFYFLFVSEWASAAKSHVEPFWTDPPVLTEDESSESVGRCPQPPLNRGCWLASLSEASRGGFFVYGCAQFRVSGFSPSGWWGPHFFPLLHNSSSLQGPLRVLYGALFFFLFFFLPCLSLA